MALIWRAGNLGSLLVLTLLATAQEARSGEYQDRLEAFCRRHQARTLRSVCLAAPWIAAATRKLCHGEPIEVSAPKAILYYFDGTEYFSPKEAKALGAVNLTGQEPAQSYRHSVRALGKYWIPAIEAAGASWSGDFEFRYHSGVGAQDYGIENARACFGSLRTDLEDLGALGVVKAGEIPRLIVSGHSIGGATALQFAKEIGEPVDLLLLLDPVSDIWGYVSGKLTGRRPELGPGAANVSRSVNIYQESDTGSLAGIWSIQGTPVDFAQRQIRLEMPASVKSGHDRDHVRMLSDPTAVRVLSEELAAIVRD